jgi:probable rRNA maturation factor
MLSLVVRPQVRSLVDGKLRAALRRQLGRAMRAAGLGEVQVCLTLSDDAELHELNRVYAGEDHATDVLSFAQREQRLPGPMAPPPSPRGVAGLPEPLGDIIVSIPTAQRQAAQQGHALLHELLHLSVHGLCHLLGYDHATAAQERLMFGYEALLRQQARGQGRVLPCSPPPLSAAAPASYGGSR